MAKLPIDHIQNNEEGLSVRDKLNTVIDRTNTLENIENHLDVHVNDTNNPHKVKAPQVELEPVITPLGPGEQNVQDALEWLYSHFEENGGAGWHLDAIDGIYTVIQINRGPTTQFPPDPNDLKVGELKLDWNEGKLWTKIGDNSDVIIGGKDVIFEAPLDGELYGRKDGEWHRISLATVSDDMPQNPQEGDLWVDTQHSMELYCYVSGNGWISMTGAGSGSGAGADNITTDEIDGTLVNKLLGRIKYEDGTAVWRPIYTSDVITEGAQPMFRSTETGRFTKATDPSAIRDQQTANWFLYESMMEMGGNYVPVSGGEFEGPIFGPTVNNIVRDRDCTLVVTGSSINPHDDPTCPVDNVVVQTRYSAGSLDFETDNRMKIHMPRGNADDYAGQEFIEYVLLQPGGIVQVWQCKDSGFSSDNGNCLNVVGYLVSGDTLVPGEPVEVWRSEVTASPYVTLEMLRKILDNVEGGASVTIDTQAPANPSDGDLWFDNTENIMQLFLYHEASDAWLPVAPPATLESRVRAGEITQEAIIAQIQESLKEQERINRNVNNLKFDVDKKVDLQGANDLYPDQAWVLKQDKLGGGTSTFVTIHNGEMGLYNVQSPQAGHHAANMEYVDGVSAEVDGLAERVSQGEVEQETLKAKVNALEGALGEHRLMFTWSENNVRPGQFNLKNDLMQLKGYLSEATWIGISSTDSDGGAIDLDRIKEGDILRMSDYGGMAAELKITRADTAGLYKFEKVSGTLDRMSEVYPYDFILLSAFDPAGLASISYVDAQDSKKLNKSGGTMTGDLSLKRTDDTYWTYIRTLKPEAWNASQDTHGLIIDIGNTNSYKQQLKIQGRSGKDLFEMHDDGKAQATLLGNLDVANVLKQGGYPVATQVYVQEALAGIEIPEAVEAERPILWKYNPDVPANDLANGEFNLSSGLSNGAAADWSIYFAKRDARGYYWYPHDSGNSYTHEIDVQMATIRGRDQVCVHGKTNKWYFNQGTNKYAQLRLSYYRSSNALAKGKYYLLTIPGYMPYFAFGVDAQTNGTH